MFKKPVLNEYYLVVLAHFKKTPNPAKKNPKQNRLAGLPQTISPILQPPLLVNIVSFHHKIIFTSKK